MVHSRNHTLACWTEPQNPIPIQTQKKNKIKHNKLIPIQTPNELTKFIKSYNQKKKKTKPRERESTFGLGDGDGDGTFLASRRKPRSTDPKKKKKNKKPKNKKWRRVKMKQIDLMKES